VTIGHTVTHFLVTSHDMVTVTGCRKECTGKMMSVRHGSYWGRSLQNGLGDEQTCGTTLASAYMLCCLSAAWLQLQMKERKSE